MLWQPSLPQRYLDLSEDLLGHAITARRGELGDALLILGHHYQQDDVIRHADFTGDSLKLSQLAAEQATRRGTKSIVFCGVHFMAETADILTDESVQVILPDLSAGCSMADMADYEDVVDAWRMIHEAHGCRPAGPSGESKGRRSGANGSTGSTRRQGDAVTPGPLSGGPSGRGGSLVQFKHRGTPIQSPGKSAKQLRVIPITYVNSSAAIKAFVGEHGGACCTSTNAGEIFRWALAGGTKPAARGEQIKIIFMPDQHLGRNTASKHGFLTEVDEAAGRGASQTALWNPRLDGGGGGGLTDSQIQQARVLLWAGHCSVHKLFRPEHVDEIRAEFAPEGGITVLVHPECCKEVVDKADLSGSTEYIIRTIEHAPAGSRWAVGTEVHLVNRLAAAAAQRGVLVRILSDCQCLCTTMYRIDQQHLLWVLDNLAEGKVVNRVTVPVRVRALARLALDRMLENSHAGQPPPAPAMID